jgi:hypothetical protein
LFKATVGHAAYSGFVSDGSAANAMHLECFKSHFLTSLDADLQRVFEGWARLPEEMRRAILALAEANAQPAH